VLPLLLLLAGCGGGVEDPDVPDSQRAACASLVEALPTTVSSQPRETTATRYAASWGDPAIVLRCGVPAPGEKDKFAPCQTVDGVDWVAPESASDDQRADVTLTTVGRVPRVELTVPARYRPPVAALVDVASAVGAHSTVQKRCG
jgi:hypothetical protein